MNLFGASRSSSVRVKDVCSDAGLTERYFYESFNDMEAFFDAVLEQVMQEIESDVAAVLEDAPDDGLSRRRAAQRQAIDTLLSDPRKVRIVCVETLRKGGRAAMRQHEFNVRGAGNFLAWAGINGGGFEDSPVEARMRALAAAAAGSELLISWVEGLLEIDPAELANYLVQLSEHILLQETSSRTTKTSKGSTKAAPRPKRRRA